MTSYRVTILHLLLLAALVVLPAAEVEGQSDVPPGDDRHGKEGTWDLGRKPPPPAPEKDFRETDLKKSLRRIRCDLHEVQDLGRIYVQELGGGAPYWIQLPNTVKIRAYSKADFDGRKKLKLEDLEAGQRLELTLRKKSDEIMIVRVRRP